MTLRGLRETLVSQGAAEQSADVSVLCPGWPAVPLNPVVEAGLFGLRPCLSVSAACLSAL